MPRWLSGLVLAVLLAGNFGVPIADALAFHRTADPHGNVPVLGAPDQPVEHAATCALTGAPAASLQAPCITGRLVASLSSAAPQIVPPAAMPPHLPVADSRPRAPPVQPA